MKYVALLRGINVGGKNKVSMPELKKCFETLGFSGVSTYINSGNVIFDSSEQSTARLVQKCERVIEATFGLNVACSVISAIDYQDALANAPEWWGLDDGEKHNAIFVIAPTTTNEVMQEVGDAKLDYELVAAHGSVIFWSAPLKTFGKTRYSKIVGNKAYRSVTIRNSNTTKKIAALLG